MMNTFAEYFELYSPRVLVQDDDLEVFTYGQVLALGNEITSSVKPEKSLVFLICSNDSRSLAAYMSLVIADHAIVLLDNEASSETISELVEKYQPDYLVSPAKRNQSVEVINKKRSSVVFDELSVMLSTSGSTGSPKLACFTQRQLLENAVSIAKYLKINSEDVAFAHLPSNYSFGLSILHSHIVSGASFRLTKKTIMEKEFWQALNNSGATSFSGVPFHFEMLARLRYPFKNCSSLKYLAQAGGRLNPKLVTEYADLCEDMKISFYVMYGQTEAAPRISYLPFELVKDNPDSIGLPIPGVSLSVVDKNGVSLDVDQEGELVCSSPSVMLGYAYSEEDLKLGDRMNGELYTGDIGKYDKNGLFRITGRSNRFLKIQGTRVGLDEVEAKILTAGFAAACVGFDDWLCIALEAGQSIDDVRQFANREFKISPRSVDIVEVSSLPRKSSGKIDYNSLLALVNPQTDK